MRLDFVVVGGGLCGALAAQQLARSGKRVSLIEAGPTSLRALPGDVRGFQRSTAALMKVDPKQWPFRGPRDYEWHRVRAPGGRTLLWGGWMQRPSPAYFAARRAFGAGWSLSHAAIEPWLKRAERRLNVRVARRGALHARLETLGFDALPKHEAVLAGSRRMLTARDLELPSTQRGRVLSVHSAAHGVTLHLDDGRELAARRVILAASPIETGTCLPALDAQGRWLECPEVFVADGSGVPGATDGHPSLALAANALRVATAAGTSG